MSGVLWVLMALSIASGGETTPPSPAAGQKAAPRYAEDPRAYEVGKLLRCPVCQGMPIADSPADMAQSMMARVREMSAEGKSRDEMIDYFTERYGDWVLLEPRKEGLNWLVWVMPPVFLLLGLLVAVGYGRRPKDVVASASESTEDTEDPYVRAIRDEVDG